jgi:hypothetical protein
MRHIGLGGASAIDTESAIQMQIDQAGGKNAAIQRDDRVIGWGALMERRDDPIADLDHARPGDFAIAEQGRGRDQHGGSGDQHGAESTSCKQMHMQMRHFLMAVRPHICE